MQTNYHYHYHPETHEYLSASEALFSPLEPDVLEQIENSSHKAPPLVGEHEIAVFVSADDDWIVKPDWRETALFSIQDGSLVQGVALGQTPQELNATEFERPSACHTWDGQTWQLDDHLLATKLKLRLDEKNADISAWRDEQEKAPIIFMHANRQWDGGLNVKMRLDTVAALPELPADYYWTDADNHDVPMDLSSIQALRQAHEIAIAAQGWQIHQRQREMKAEVAGLSGEALSTYVVGWPITA